MLGSEFGYLLNRCLVDEMSVWVQQTPCRRLSRLADALEAAVPAKENVGWPLLSYEALAIEDAEGGGEGGSQSEGGGDSESEGGGEGDSEMGCEGESVRGAHSSGDGPEARAATPAGGRGPLIVVLGDAEVGEGASSGMELEADGTLV
eukprot:scaffold8321_cov138-Isochrysis_galbana.AAC.5